jgi:two-component system cell cycle sensor histidine kinase PleC
MPSESEDTIVARSRFLADIGHEVRGALHAIIGFSELLKEEAFGPLNSQQRVAVGDIHGAARHLLRVLDDTLDIGRQRMARLEVETELMPLAQAVEQAVAACRAQADEKHLTLQAHVGREVAVWADESRVVQVLRNLLTNAIHHSPPHTVVTISAHAEEDVVWTLVQDQGPGIDPAEQERIFEPFVALGSDEEASTAGLGLAISRSLVVAMGGEIAVTSAPGKGATFRFSLPRGEAPV